jgi:hypothetical protein
MLDYSWQVRVFGPPPWNEEGEISEIGFFCIDAKPTIVELITPADTEPPECLEFGSSVTFTWKTVPLAQGYRVRVHELIGIPEQPFQKGITVLDTIVPAASADVQAETFFTISGPTSGNPDAIGYIWEMHAVGPDQLPGLEFGSSWYYLKPTIPEILVSDLVYTEGDAAMIGWSTQMAHGGGFILSVYEGVDCSGDLVFSKEEQGFSPGVTEKELINLWLDKQYSWRVKPFSYDGCPPKLWSSCGKIRVKKKYVAPQPTADCGGEYITWGTVFTAVHHIDLHKIPSTSDTPVAFTFSYDAINIPDRFVISYEGAILWNECVTGKNDVALVLPDSGTTSVVTVHVIPNCLATYQGATEWEFKVSCE